MNMNKRRGYEQRLRAQKSLDTEERILEEAERLFSHESFDRVTLAAVAEASGVSVPTLQRRFGNKDGLFAAVGARVRSRVVAQRSPPRSEVGDAVDAALDVLLAHYELEGRMVWHLLRQEQDVPQLHDALGEARAVHRAWVEQVFSSSLSSLEGAARDRRADALVAATDLYSWKLLRIDLGRSREQAGLVMKAMARAVAAEEC